MRQLDDRRLFWRANIGGVEKTWEAEITEQTPDERIAWHNVTGAKNAGVVTFHRLTDDRSKIMLQMDYDPRASSRTSATSSGVASTRVKGDLERFKEFIESRGRETGAWRGEVRQHHS